MYPVKPETEPSERGKKRRAWISQFVEANQRRKVDRAMVVLDFQLNDIDQFSETEKEWIREKVRRELDRLHHPKRNRGRRSVHTVGSRIHTPGRSRFVTDKDKADIGRATRRKNFLVSFYAEAKDLPLARARSILAERLDAEVAFTKGERDWITETALFRLEEYHQKKGLK